VCGTTGGAESVRRHGAKGDEEGKKRVGKGGERRGVGGDNRVGNNEADHCCTPVPGKFLNHPLFV
jgi:hypothetical protein